MKMSEKFCLKWNDFQSNVSISFGLLRNEDYLHDVTIVTDDNVQIPAHRLVLSACSEYFKNIFMKNKNTNLLICLEGVNSHDVRNILDYIYNGDVKIYQEHIDRFLEVAQRFKLEGLQVNNRQDKSPEEITQQLKKAEDQKPLGGKNPSSQKSNNRQPKVGNERAVVSNNIPLNPHSEVLTEINNQIDEHTEKALDGTYVCKLCGKKTGANKAHIRNHIETHLDGLSFNCQHCGKAFRSRNSLSKHISVYHKFL